MYPNQSTVAYFWVWIIDIVDSSLLMKMYYEPLPMVLVGEGRECSLRISTGYVNHSRTCLPQNLFDVFSISLCSCLEISGINRFSAWKC